MARTLIQQANYLMSIYLNEYKDKYGPHKSFNKYREKWGFQSMAEDLGESRAVETIEHYFTTNRYGHDAKYLLNNYDKISEVMYEIEKDAVDREKIRLQTERLVEERKWQQQN